MLRRNKDTFAQICQLITHLFHMIIRYKKYLRLIRIAEQTAELLLLAGVFDEDLHTSLHRFRRTAELVPSVSPVDLENQLNTLRNIYSNHNDRYNNRHLLASRRTSRCVRGRIIFCR